MYIAKQFRVEEQEKIISFVKDNSFGILVSTVEGNSYATHLPFLIEQNEDGSLVLRSHIAKANAHWQQLDGSKALAIFNGPHAFISNTWYEEPNTVSTWNYVAVHMTGTVHFITDKVDFEKLLHETEAFYNAMYADDPLQQNEPRYIDKMMNGIIGFEIHVSHVEGKWKLSQNHSEERQRKVITKLRNQLDEQSKTIADLMDKNLSI